MKKSPIYLIFLCCISFASAQNAKNVEDGIFKINALAPGVSYEVGIANDITLNFDAIFGFLISGGSNRDTEFGVFPGIKADFRYFTNMKRRLGKRKNISGNSGNYLALSNQLTSGNSIIGNVDYNSNFFYSISVLYGIQRTRPKGFYWGVSFGPALFTDQFETNFGLNLDARIGWVINKRNKN